MIFKRGSFLQFRQVDPYNLLHGENQNTVWHKLSKQKNTFSEFPAEVLKREWQKALTNLVKDEDMRQKYSAKDTNLDYTKQLVNAFKEISWNVPQTAFHHMYITSMADLLDPTFQQHFCFAGCKAMNKTRDLFLTTGRDQLMSPNYKQELAPGISNLYLLPWTTK